jgi:hypothetical protein
MAKLEQYRRTTSLRLGDVVLAVAVALLFVSVSGAYGVTSAPASDIARCGFESPRARLLLMVLVLLALAVLSFMFLLAALAVLRWGRRFRSRLKGRGMQATPSDDVWSKYRLPDEDQDGRHEEPDDEAGDEDDS